MYDKKILVVTPDSSQLAYCLNFLGKHGFHIYGATNYKEAMTVDHIENTDLVIILKKTGNKDRDYIIDFIRSISASKKVIEFSGPVHLLPQKIRSLE